MSIKYNLEGHRSGRLVVERLHHQNIKGTKYWLCKCDCGGSAIVVTTPLVKQKTKSCGCINKEITSLRRKTHGMTNSVEYTCWTEMKYRCARKTHKYYHCYGGRGIKVCDRWLVSFENFFSDMGLRPTINHSIERVDVNGDYTPANCVWGTFEQQVRNRRDNRYITYNNERLIMCDWAKKFNLNPATLHSQLRKKTIDQAIDYYIGTGALIVSEGITIANPNYVKAG